MFLKIGLVYFLYKYVILSDNLYHISSRPYHMTSGMVALNP